MTSSIHEKRYLGFDILRIVSMIAIVVLHINEAVFWTDTNPIVSSLFAYRYILEFSQHITFSGFTVIALSFFLLGRSRRKNFLPLLGFLIVGIFVLAIYQADPPFQGFYWEWDIYSFLLVAAIVVQLLALVPKIHGLVLGIALVVLWIPFWNMIPNSEGVVSQALVGACPPLGGGSWPLLPWLGWPVLFFCMGTLVKESKKVQQWMSELKLKELIVWALVLGISVPFFGVFNYVPIGPNFYCHTLRFEPYLFWATIIWVVFLMRLSLVKGINHWLSLRPGIRAISDLRWNRRFGSTYMTHLLLLGIAIYLRPVFLQHPWVFDLYFVGILPTAEVLVRIFEKLVSVVRGHNAVGA